MTQQTELLGAVVTSRAGPRSSEAVPAMEDGRDAAWEQHPVDIRLSLPLIFARYYITIVAGKERRSAARRASERRKHPLNTSGNNLVMAVVGCVLGLAIYGLSMAVGWWAVERFILAP
jgi:hypothetical protein